MDKLEIGRTQGVFLQNPKNMNEVYRFIQIVPNKRFIYHYNLVGTRVVRQSICKVCGPAEGNQFYKDLKLKGYEVMTADEKNKFIKKVEEAKSIK